MKNFKKNKGDSKNRYRIKDESLVLRLGLEPNKSGRYRLSPKQVESLINGEVRPIKRLFYDIETTLGKYYAYGPSWKTSIKMYQEIEAPNICVISYKWQGENKVHRLVYDQSNKCDHDLISDFIKVLNQADEIVAHNGDKFDIKVIRTHALMNGIPMRPIYKSFDTLKKARSFFAFRDNRLDALAQRLQVGAKLSHEGFKMWTKVTEGDPEALKDMGDYCDIDVVVLEDVYTAMQPYVTHNTHAGVIAGNPTYSCPHCGANGRITLIDKFVTPAGTIQRIVQNECGHEYKMTNAVYMRYLKQKVYNLL